MANNLINVPGANRGGSAGIFLGSTITTGVAAYSIASGAALASAPIALSVGVVGAISGGLALWSGRKIFKAAWPHERTPESPDIISGIFRQVAPTYLQTFPDDVSRTPFKEKMAAAVKGGAYGFAFMMTPYVSTVVQTWTGLSPSLATGIGFLAGWVRSDAKGAADPQAQRPAPPPRRAGGFAAPRAAGVGVGLGRQAAPAFGAANAARARAMPVDVLDRELAVPVKIPGDQTDYWTIRAAYERARNAWGLLPRSRQATNADLMRQVAQNAFSMAGNEFIVPMNRAGFQAARHADFDDRILSNILVGSAEAAGFDFI